MQRVLLFSKAYVKLTHARTESLKLVSRTRIGGVFAIFCIHGGRVHRTQAVLVVAHRRNNSSQAG